MSAQLFKEARTVAQSFVDFVNDAKSPWHAVDTVRRLLLKKGYSQLHEKDNWKPKINTNGRYFFTRNESSIVAFAIGGKYKAGNGFKIIGAHTDSPDLKIKPISAQEKVGYLQVSVQTYGGGLWYSWFDRDLTVAGRAIIETEEKRFEHKLVHIKRPILRIPSLAIHMNREVNEKGFSFNTETNLLPVISTAVKEQLGEGEKKEEKKGIEASHHPILLNLLAEELNCKVSNIRDLELSIVDTQPALVGGAQDEFIFAPRIDNLMSCYCGLEALFNTDGSLENDEDVRMVAMFDHEEIGSKSATGAYSSLLNDVLKRVITVLSTEETPGDAYEQSIHKSFLVSADMAHAVHPNYSEKHQEKHRPMIHKGPVIKVNANQRYATNAVTGFIMKEIANRNNVPYQEFVVRNDVGCGSTIGPLLAGQLGVRTVDIGIPQLSMHSIREMCGTVDVKYGVELLTGFIKDFRAVDSVIKID